MDLTTKGLCWLLDRAKVFTISPLLVQTMRAEHRRVKCV